MASGVFFLGCCCAESQEHMKQTAAELTEDLTRAEMLEHLQFIKRLPHKLLRDIGFIIAGPSLLSNSVEVRAITLTSYCSTNRGQVGV
jgi:hypothetical protein